MTHQPRWWPLFLTNFLGVLNDNYLKTLACFIAVAWVGLKYEAMLVSAAAASLVLPYVLLSPLAGRWAVIFRKIQVVRVAKFVEILIMLLATAGFILENVWIVMSCILFMGTQSCLFSPSKYGLIRDIGGQENVPFGTGNMEMVSFLGMLCGTMFASFFADTLSSWELGMTFLFVSGLGFAGSLFIKANESPTVEDSDTVRPIKYLLGSIREARKYRGLNSTIVALSVFWFMAAIVQMTLLVFCRRNLEMTDFQTGIVLTLAAIGTGIGCFISGVLSKKGNRNRIVTLSGTGISILFLFIFVYPVKGPVFGLILFVTGFLCGLFKVPFDSAIIEKVPGRALGHMLAYSNQLSFLFILAGSGAFALITGFLGTSFIFLFLALVMGSTTLYVTFSKYLCACNLRKQT